MYLNNGPAYYYYQRLQKNLKVVLMGCDHSFDNCFCVSIGTNESTNYDMSIDLQPDGTYLVNCPNAAWTRSDKKYYRLILQGRTGKKNPRLGEDFIKWADEDSIIKIILNTYDYVKEYIDPNAPGGKELIGYIVDRTGFKEFKRWALRDVKLPEIAEVMTPCTGKE